MRAHHDEIRPALMRYPHDSVRRVSHRHFHLPGSVATLEHEVLQMRQGFRSMILEYDGGLWWARVTEVALQGGLKTDLRPRPPGNGIHVRPGMRWQHVQEGHFGLM